MDYKPNEQGHWRKHLAPNTTRVTKVKARHAHWPSNLFCSKRSYLLDTVAEPEREQVLGLFGMVLPSSGSTALFSTETV
jgi:hypothetical protein